MWEFRERCLIHDFQIIPEKSIIYEPLCNLSHKPVKTERNSKITFFILLSSWLTELSLPNIFVDLQKCLPSIYYLNYQSLEGISTCEPGKKCSSYWVSPREGKALAWGSVSVSSYVITSHLDAVKTYLAFCLSSSLHYYVILVWAHVPTTMHIIFSMH